MHIVTMRNENKIILLIIKVFVKIFTIIEIIKKKIQKTTSEYKL